MGTDYGYRRMDTFRGTARECGAGPGGRCVDAPDWLDGAGAVTAVLGSTETTAQVHPGRFTTALLDAAQRLGTVLRIGIVEGVAQRDGAIHGAIADGEVVKADAVVLALGPWTSLAPPGTSRCQRCAGSKATV